MNEYQPPVADLLTLGRPGTDEWPDYLPRGFTPEHVPELLRMVADQELAARGPADLAGWAPVHAWRVLGQLRALEVVAPLLGQLGRLVETYHDWALEEVPDVLKLMGPACLPVLEAFIVEPSSRLFPRWVVSDGLVKIGQESPESRAECVAILTRALEREDDPEVNGALVNGLLDLKAVEALPVLEQAYDADRVDESMVAWEDVQEELGLIPPRVWDRPAPPPPPRPGPRPRLTATIIPPRMSPPPAASPPVPSPKARAEERRKAQRKQKKSGKQDRKKK